MKRRFILFAALLPLSLVFSIGLTGAKNPEHGRVPGTLQRANPAPDIQPFEDHPHGGAAISGVKAILPKTDDFSPYVAGMVAQVSQEQYTEYLQTLQDFVTRNTLTTNCDQAAAWILSQFQSFGLDAYYDAFTLSGQTKFNVIGELPGSVYPDSVLFITAHYDATAGQPLSPEPVAPGADDNGSGTACVIECARILSRYQFERTIRFVAFAGEEQGLVGSFYYVQHLLQANTAVVGSFNHDMIAASGSGSPPYSMSIITNNNPISLAMAAKISEAASTFIPWYMTANVVIAPGSASSDHYFFWQAGWAATFSIQAAAYPYYHTANDLLVNCNMEYAANFTKTAIAALADFAVPLGGGTELAGAVSGVWTQAGNPYSVVDSIWVSQDSSLTIEPGVFIIFNGHYPFKVLQNATLRALGSADDPIQFLATDPDSGWGGIRFLSASDSSRLEFCSLKHGWAYGAGEDAWGGGIYCSASSPVLDHCLISNCSAGQGGAVACTNSSNSIISNCTFADNSAGSGDGLYCSDSSPILHNCILWDMSTPEIATIGMSDPQITYSDILGGWPGEGNLSSNPLFVNPSLGNYHLQSIVGSYAFGAWAPDSSYSPCIDAGDPASSYSDEPEPNGDRIDMGNYGNTAQASLSLNDPHYAFGEVSGSWSATENNPMYVIGNIYIPSGQTLVIEPGVQVIFQGHYRLEVDGAATLLAVGTIEDSITFTAADPEEGWQGIRFLSASDSSYLQYCHLTRGIAEGPGEYAWGGAIFCDSAANATVQNCLIDSCQAISGGAIYCTQAAPAISGCALIGNSASSGGAIYCAEASPVIRGCALIGDSAGSGGAIYCNHSSPVIEGNALSENSGSNGGAVTLWFSSGQINNNVISENSAIGFAGGIYCFNSDPTLVNNTIAANSSANGGGIFTVGNLSLELINCILCDNSSTQMVVGGGTSPQVSYCDIQGGWPGEGNLDVDPEFLSGPLSNYQLSAGSPCVDAGNPDSQYNDPEDPANPGYALWPAWGTVRNDLGAFGGQGATNWVGVEPGPEKHNISKEFSLEQNYPNPFNPTTTIRFALPQPARISLKIFDIQGKEVATLADGWFGAGSHQVTFSHKDLASGIYIYKLEANDHAASGKMVLMK